MTFRKKIRDAGGKLECGLVTSFVVSLVILCCTSLTRGAENDRFVNAAVVTVNETQNGLIRTITGTTFGSGTEAGEATSSQHTVWYRFEPAFDGSIDPEVVKSGHFLTVYRGDALNELVPVSHATPVLFAAGEVIHFAVGDDPAIAGNGGDFVLTLTLGPTNGLFKDAINLGSSGNFSYDQTRIFVGSTQFAADEPNDQSSRPSVWYSYTSDTFDTFSIGFDSPGHLVSVFSGSSLDNLVPVLPAIAGRYQFAPGLSYFFAIPDDPAVPGNGNAFALHITKGPANDALSNAVNLGSDGSFGERATRVFNGSVRHATPEGFGPDGLANVWYWIRTEDQFHGSFRFETETNEHIVEIYQLNGEAEIFRVETDLSGAYLLSPSEDYFISVADNPNLPGNGGDFVLRITKGPSNDAWDRALNLGDEGSFIPGVPRVYNQSTFHATNEVGEDEGSRNVWYRLSTNTTFRGSFRFEVETPEHGLELYTGSGIEDLTRIIPFESGLYFLEAGQDYYLSVFDNLDFESEGEDFVLTVTRGPINDAITSPIHLGDDGTFLTGVSRIYDGSVRHATSDGIDGGNDADVWYSLSTTAAFSGPFCFATYGEEHLVHFYQRSEDGDLIRMTPKGPGLYSTEPGSEYLVQVLDNPEVPRNGGEYVLKVTRGPASDDFINAIAIGSDTSFTTGATRIFQSSTTLATLEVGQPGDNRGIWYRLDMTNAEEFRIQADTAEHLVEVYQGNAFDSLIPVLSDSDFYSLFPSNAYYLHVIDNPEVEGNGGEFVLTVTKGVSPSINPPVNDNVGDATDLVANTSWNPGVSVVRNGSTTLASAEEGESDQNPSVWYRLVTSSVGGAFSFRTEDNEHLVEVFEGTGLSDLTAVPDQGEGVFQLNPRENYRIRVSDNPEVPGNGNEFALTFTRGPVNDNVGDATDLVANTSWNPGVSVVRNGSTTLASAEEAESDQNPSVWYRLVTSSVGGAFSFRTEDNEHLVEVFEGTGLSDLTAVPDQGEGVFQLNPRENYRIRVSDNPEVPGNGNEFALTFTRGPVNDNVGDATDLVANTSWNPGVSVVRNGSTTLASAEEAESDQNPSVWYRLVTSSVGGAFSFRTEDDEHLVEVFEGTGLSDLTAVPDQGEGVFQLNPRENYRIRVSDNPEVPGNGNEFALTFTRGPVNDNVGDATDLVANTSWNPGVSVVRNGSTTLASAEEAESDQNPSVWYRLVTSSVGGAFSFRTEDDEHLVEVFEGTGLSDLTAVPDQGEGVFQLNPRENYRIRVSDNPEVPGNGNEFALTFTRGPVNDNVGDATDLVANTSWNPGVSVVRNGSTTLASAEEAESDQNPSVWYRLVTSSVGGAFSFRTEDNEHLVEVFEGTGLSDLTAVPDQGEGVFQLNPRENYRIRVSDNPEVPGNGNEFKLIFTRAPANDNFRDFQSFSGSIAEFGNVLFRGFLTNASNEEGETNPLGNVWYRFSPSFSGPVRALALGTEQVVRVYQSLPDGLRLLVEDGLFGAFRNMTYYLEVIAANAAESDPDQHAVFLRRGPQNDLFDQSEIVSRPAVGNTVVVSGTTFDSLNDSPFPDRGFDNGRRNVWYRISGTGRMGVRVSIGADPTKQFTILSQTSGGNLRILGAGRRRQDCNLFFQDNRTFFISVSDRADNPSPEGSPFTLTFRGLSPEETIVLPNANVFRFARATTTTNTAIGRLLVRGRVVFRRRSFVFNNVPRCFQYDPVPTDTYVFEMLDGALFTQIIDFPVGFTNSFEVLVGDESLGFFSPNQVLDFEELLGNGVSKFTVTGINPTVDGDDPTIFPIGLSFNRETASFSMTPVPVGEEEPKSAIEGLNLIEDDEGNYFIVATTVEGVSHQLESSTDLTQDDWNPLGEAFDGTGGVQTIPLNSSPSERVFYRLRSIETGP